MIAARHDSGAMLVVKNGSVIVWPPAEFVAKIGAMRAHGKISKRLADEVFEAWENYFWKEAENEL